MREREATVMWLIGSQELNLIKGDKQSARTYTPCTHNFKSNYTSMCCKQFHYYNNVCTYTLISGFHFETLKFFLRGENMFASMWRVAESCLFFFFAFVMAAQGDDIEIKWWAYKVDLYIYVVNTQYLPTVFICHLNIRYHMD